MSSQSGLVSGESVLFSVCCHSLSSTVPAGEGTSAVPGLVTCPSIPPQLRQGHCDRNGDCENRTRQGARGTVIYGIKIQNSTLARKACKREQCVKRSFISSY